MRAWLLVAGLLVGGSPLLAATRVTIQDLKDFPERYEGQTVLLECYYDKESPIWVRALPDADEWIGFFVTGKPEKAITWSGEYYNLFFAPYAMREALRTLRGGDKLTVIGKVFRYHSTSFDGAGIHVTRLLSGWGPSAKAVGESVPSVLVPTASAAPILAPPLVAGNEHQPSTVVGEKYAVTINGKHYDGLRFGDQYTFDDIEFRVDKTQ
jgi:hypothetical protein